MTLWWTAILIVQTKHQPLMKIITIHSNNNSQNNCVPTDEHLKSLKTLEFECGVVLLEKPGHWVALLSE